MEVCNEDIAVFAFPKSGIAEFMESIGFEIHILKTVVSPKEGGISKVNIRFMGRENAPRSGARGNRHSPGWFS